MTANRERALERALQQLLQAADDYTHMIDKFAGDDWLTAKRRRPRMALDDAQKAARETLRSSVVQIGAFTFIHVEPTGYAKSLHGDRVPTGFPAADRVYGQRVRRVRTACKRTLAEAARLLGLSVTNLSDVEMGRLRPVEPVQFFDAVSEL